MSDPIGVITLTDLRRKVAWMFYGTRTYSDLDSDSQDVVDEIINDGYERFLSPPPINNEPSPHRWGFLRPVLSITTEKDMEDYALPQNFGGLDGKLFYARSDGKLWPITKTDVSRIQLLRQRDTLTVTSYPVEYAIRPGDPSGLGQPPSILMLWPTPDSAYTVKSRYFIIAGKLSEAYPYPACDAYHNQTLAESCLAVAEERLEDQQAIHSQNFLRLLAASVDYDRDKYAPDHISYDQDYSDGRVTPEDVRASGDYVTYNGYTPGA